MENEMTGKTDQIAAYLKRAFMFLEDGEWANASAYGEKVLDIDPENAEAYLCKLMSEMQVAKREDLAKCKSPLTENKNYAKIIRFGNEALVAEMEGYGKAIKDSQELAKKEAAYVEAKKLSENAKYALHMSEAANMFEKLGDYKDAVSRAEYCRKSVKLMEEAEQKAAEAARERFKERQEAEAVRKAAYEKYLEKYPMVKQIDSLNAKRAELLNTDTKMPKIFVFIYTIVAVGFFSWISLLFIDDGYEKPLYIVAAVFFGLFYILFTYLWIKSKIRKNNIQKQIKAIDQMLAEIAKIPPFEG